MLRKLSLIAAVVAAFAAFVAVPAFARSSHATGTTVKVAASEFKFVLSTKTVHAGSTTFVVTNKGAAGHDFKIAGKKTPVIGHGKTARLTVTLKRGKYPYSCTVPGHAAAGMKGTLTVK